MSASNLEPSAYRPFESVERFIIDCTAEIWAERGVGRIRDYYAPEIQLHLPSGSKTVTADGIVAMTIMRLSTDPNFGECPIGQDIVWEARGSTRFISSHRVYDPPTKRNCIAHCLVDDARFVEEWVVYDDTATLKAAGIDPDVAAAALLVDTGTAVFTGEFPSPLQRGVSGERSHSDTASVPDHDAPVVARLKRADAIILGKTNMPELGADGTRSGTSWSGHTYNAVDRRLAPGGSSSGTATAIAGNMAVLGIAGETCGSIQNPAGAQCLVGIKPSFGLVPTAGVVPLRGSTHDVIGTQARTVHDAALMLDVLAGYSSEDLKTAACVGKIPLGGYTSKLERHALAGKRIGLHGPGWNPIGEVLSGETQHLYARVIRELRSRGAIVTPASFEGTGIAELVALSTIGEPTGVFDMENYLNRFASASPIHSVAGLLKETHAFPRVWKEWFGTVNAVPDPKRAPDPAQFIKTQSRGLRIIDEVTRRYQLDAFIYPQMMAETPLLETAEPIQPVAATIISITGLPLVTVPAGYYESGSPFAIALFGKMWSEADLLGMAYDYEQATHHRKAPELTTLSAAMPIAPCR